MPADSVGVAMLVVLETLSPAERLAFVLHDTFGLPFDQIAPIVGRTPATTRQLASRARRRVRGATPSEVVNPHQQREIIDAFLAAARRVDFEALLAVLDPEAVVRADGGAGGSLIGWTRVTHGAERVAHKAIGFRRLADGARHAWVDGAPGFAVFAGERLFAVLGFTIRDGRIAAIDVLVDPARLDRPGLTRRYG